jgi:hypothetical protein
MLLSFESSCKLVTKDHSNDSIPEKQHMASQKTSTSHVATILSIFCNHLANLLQKIIAFQKPNTRFACYYIL